MNYTRPLESLHTFAVKASKHHDKWAGIDGWCYNGGTIVVIFLLFLAALLPAAAGASLIASKLLAGLGAAWIAADRALQFGPRWRFHTEMRAGYEAAQLSITTFDANEPDAQPEAYRKIKESIDLLIERERTIPGIGAIEKAFSERPEPP
jgi:hypothetical protein